MQDTIDALNGENIVYEIFNEIMENPTLEVLDHASELFSNSHIDFIIGIGGGSPLDAAKGIAVLLDNKTVTARHLLSPNTLSYLPVIAIPTTAGTGSETTPYAIFTDNEYKTKINFKSQVFPEYAMIDKKYFKFMPLHILRSTAVDSLCHITEGYLNIKSNPVSDLIAEKALETWAAIKVSILHGNLSDNDYDNLILASTLGGMVISQTGTSLPHALGYYLTYYYDVLHGNATASFLGELFSFHENTDKVSSILKYLDFESISAFKSYLREVIGVIEVSREDIDIYIDAVAQNKEKLKNHPYPISRDDIERFYMRSVKVV